MAHNIATINGRDAMMYNNRTPWHGIGIRLTGAPTMAEALTAANLDWRVTTEKLYLADGRTIDGKRAIVRDGDDRPVFGVVSDRYTPIQNSDAFGVFNEALTVHGLTIESAGALGSGEKTWMLFRLPDSTVSPVDGDDVRGYAVAINAHDGSSVFECRPTPIRVVCQNTLTMAVGAGGSKGQVFAIRHTKSADERVAQVGTIVDGMLRAMRETGDTFARLAQRRMTPVEIANYIETVFPVPAGEKEVSSRLDNKRRAVAQLTYRGVGVELATRGTNGDPNAWSVYNSVTEYFDHVVPANSSNPIKANTSALFGSGADVKALALATARQLVTV